MPSKTPTSSLRMSYELIWETPEVHVVRVPFLHLGLDFTNCYIVRDGDDVLIIDQGAATPLASRAFERIADEIGVDLSKARFLCTHLHFDHAMLLKQLVRPGSRILLGEAAFNDNPWNFYEQRKALLRSVLREEGVPPAAMRGLAAVKTEARVCDLRDCTYELLRDGQTIRVGAHELRVIATPGHSAGHICLYSEEQRLLFSGDHVLETITPGLTLPFEGDDSLRDYLDSLSKVEHLTCDLVLPGHKNAFSDLAGRCDSLRQYHARRLIQVFEIVARNPNLNGRAIMRKMPWRRINLAEDWDNVSLFRRMSMAAQTFSHLEFLVNIGEIVREEDFSGRHYHI